MGNNAFSLLIHDNLFFFVLQGFTTRNLTNTNRTPIIFLLVDCSEFYRQTFSLLNIDKNISLINTDGIAVENEGIK